MRVVRNLLLAALVVLLAVLVTLAMLLLTAKEQSFLTLSEAAGDCIPPQGWTAHVVQVGENLALIADIVGVEPAELVFANCLRGDIHPGDTIFLPPPSRSQDACGPPQGWTLYEIQPGDSLPLLAERFAVSEAALWHANCISESMTFQPGFRIYVPASSNIR